MTDQINKEPPNTDKKPVFKKQLAYSMALALLVFAVLPVSIMGLAGYLRARSLLQEQTANQFYNIAHNQASTFDLSMKTKGIRLETLNRRPAFQEIAENLINKDIDQKQLKEEFTLINYSNGSVLFNDFFLLDPQGVIYGASNSAWYQIALDDSSYYKQLTEKGSFGVYGLEPLFPEKFIIYTVSPLESKTGENLGFVVGITKDEAIREFLAETIIFNPASTAYIISENNTYLGIDPYTKELSPFIPSEEQKNIIASSSGTPTTRDTTLNFTNNVEQEVVAQVHPIYSASIDMVLEIPRDIAYGQLGSLAPFSMYLFLGTLLAMSTVLWVASSRIVKPLHSLSEAARKFSVGDWKTRAFTAKQRNDEIGELAHAFNSMADELELLYNSLKSQVDERTEYIRTASDVAQNIVTTFNLDELFEKTTRLVSERLNYYHVAIFMVGRAGKTAHLKAAYGPAAKEMLAQEHRLKIGSGSIIGWVAENNRHRAASNVGDDPLHFKNELLSETQAEIGIPISIGDTVLGVLDLQSTQPEAFDEATIAVLITLSNQIATAIQNVSLFESSDVNLHELDRLYRASREIAQEKTQDGVIEVTGRILQDSPFSTVIFTQKGKGISIFTASDPDYDMSHFSLPVFIDIPLDSISDTIKDEDKIITLGMPTTLPNDIINVAKEIGCEAISLHPMLQGETLKAAVMIGARNKDHLTQTAIQPYTNLLEMVSITLDKIQASEMTERRLAEMEAVSITNQAVAAAQDLNSLYPMLHQQVRQVLGDYPFIVALYDDISDTIHIPYAYEKGKVNSIPSFPLGEGLTSIIIRTGQPLMIVENTENRATALGAKLVGASAKSWLGAPLLVQGKVIGAIIVQDSDNENSFDDNSLRFIKTLAIQVSGAIYNIQLLENSRQRAIQLESAAEIARDISGSLHLDELLSNTVNMLRDRFNFYHASVFLIESSGQYAIIRESTGEAGAQLKRDGHKLEVGSKSIVGYVSSRGENLVIKDTNKDATYYANPLLPKTRAEAAIPLKVGERILGVLDIQSTIPYAFPEEILQTISIIADQLAIAVINTELFAETQEHLSQHRLLYHITTSAASGTTLEESLRGAVQGLQVTLGGDRVAILLLDEKRENLVVNAAIGYSEEDIAAIKVPLESGVTGWVARNQKLLRIDDIQADQRYIPFSPNTHSELAIPLTFRKETLGVLNVESELVAAYNEQDEEMLGTLAGSLAAIIANTRLLQRVRHQAERERMLYEVTGKIRRSTNIQTILSTTAKELTKAVGAQHAQIKIAIDNTSETENTHE